MALIETLTREHEIFRELIDRAENGLKHDEATARTELRDVFLILLPALDKHEQIEDLVFGHPSHASHGPARRLLLEVETQHRIIESLKKELQAALGDCGQGSFETLKSLAFSICEKLRSHFWNEESRLWPNYRLGHGRANESAIARRALKQVRELERTVEKSQIMIADYLGTKR